MSFEPLGEPRFLSLGDVLAFREEQLKRFGGQTGLRDRCLIESAIAMSQAGFGGQYLHGDLFEMAAACLFHVVQNHPFLDGIKRTGALAAYVFVRINGLRVVAPEEQFEALVRRVATGVGEKAEIAAFFREHTVGVP